MTPVAKGNNFANGALVAGSTWSDPYSPLSLTVNSVTSAGMNVSVRYDSTCASFSTATDPIAAYGGSGRVTVTAPSNCAWTAGTNATWLTLEGTTTGNGSGSFTWTATANSGTGQRVTYLTVGRSSQRLLQVGNGANVLGLSPANATVAPGTPITLSLALQDAGGIADVQDVTLSALAPGSPPCSIQATFRAGSPTFFLYDSVSNTFSTGLPAGSSATIGNTSCTLAGTGSTVTVSGSTITLGLNLAFPAAVPGVRGLYATVNNGTELPVGLLNVGTDPIPTTTTPPTALRPTTTTLSSSVAAALPGTPITVAMAVASANGAGVPTGTVTLLDGTLTMTTATLDAGGTARFSTAALGEGIHALTAIYSGDSTFATSTSAATTFTIARAATVSTLTAASSTVAAGGSTSLALTVAAVTGSAASAVSPPSGIVTLSDGATVLTAATLSGGKAVFPLTSVTAGTHAYTVAYSGDSLYLASVSNAVTLVAGKPTVTLTLAAPTIVLAGQTITVTVTASAAGTAPTGSILLQQGGQTIGTAPLNGGVATLAVGPLTAGAHALTATYSGDAGAASAAAATVTVNALDFALSGPASQTGGQADITVKAGATSGNTASLALTPGAAGFPIAVTFTCTGAPAQSTCTVTPASVTPGSSATPVTVAVTTTATPTTKASVAGWYSLPLLALLAHRRTRRHGLRLCAVLLCSACALYGLAGCGAGVSGSTAQSTPAQTQGTPAGRSTLTIQGVATSGGASLARSTMITLQVN